MRNSAIIYKEGQHIGNCIYIKDSHTERKGRQTRRFAYFKCKCGDDFLSDLNKVKSGETSNCRKCKNNRIKERFTKHGLSATSEHRVWRHMLSRCYNDRVPEYKNYGGRGIIICERWKYSFEHFYSDMGPRPSPAYSIDRFPDKDGNYEPSNCRWATRKQQCLNRRSNLMITYKGETKALKEWVEELGLSYGRMRNRIKDLNWDIPKALETPY